MFVSQERFRRNPNQIIYDKKLPKVFNLRGCSLNRKAVSPILDCSCNPKGSFAYINFFTMQDEKQNYAQEADAAFLAADTCIGTAPISKLKESLTQMLFAYFTQPHDLDHEEREQMVYHYQAIFHLLTDIEPIEQTRGFLD